MGRILIAAASVKHRIELAKYLRESGHQTVEVDRLETLLHELPRQQVLVLDPPLENLAADELVARCKKANPALPIILIADDLALSASRTIRQIGIFYHALRPKTLQDIDEIEQAVRCACTRFVSDNPGVVQPQGSDGSFPDLKGGRHESEKNVEFNSGWFFDDCSSGAGGAGPRGSQRTGCVDLSRLLCPDRDCPTGSGHSAVDRYDQGAGDVTRQIVESLGQIITRPFLSFVLMEALMSRWIILCGAVLLAGGFVVLYGQMPALFSGFGGLVIWGFCGFCSIIVVAQLFAALQALLALGRSSLRRRSAQLARGGKS